MIGKTISHYRILEELGRGGMGVVYKAEDNRLRRAVALKFLTPSAVGSEQDKTRFVHEAQAAAALDHPNICTIHEFDEADGRTFIAMAYIEGASLKEKIEVGPMKLDEALDVAVQVAEGLREAHDKGVVHRDIKSANIMVTEGGQAKIMDFGLAKLAGGTQLTRTGVSMGTVAYMSPEQARGTKVDHRTDIWSFGVMLYEMITGQLPFRGEYEQAVVFSIMNEAPEPLTGLRTGVPMELERIVEKALAKDPDDRYQHIEELCVDLKLLISALEHGSLRSKPTRTGPSRRRRTYVYAGFAVLFVLLLAGGIYLRRQREQRSAESPVPVESQEGVAAAQWQNSIAVLPFRNISPDPEQEYFSDGMTEQIITNLSQLPVLKVIARTSVMKFKETEKTIPEIGTELEVAYILEGSVRRFGDRIRVTAQLIKTSDGFHLWAKDYDRELKDVFAVQDDVSEAIANSLLEALSGREASSIRTKRPGNTEAYEAFLKASYLGNRFDHVPNMDNYKNAERMFKRAIQLDSDYSPAHAGLAYLYLNYRAYIASTSEEKQEYLQLMERHVGNAIRLDPVSPAALLSKAWLHRTKGEIEEQYETIRKALTINPNHVPSNLLMGYTLRGHGLLNQSLAFFNKVAKLDPLEPWSHAARGLSFWLMGKIDSAFIEYEKTLQLEPNDSETLAFYIDNLLMMKMWQKAEQLLVRFTSISPTRDVSIYNAWLLAAKGDKQEALIEFEKIGAGRTHAEMVLNSLLGFTDKAMEYLVERHQRERSDYSISRYVHLKNHPFYDSMRGDTRFKRIVTEEEEKYPHVLKYYGV